MDKKCSWCLGNDLYIKYHDEEWGVPVYDDKVLFEFLILESAQAGLSWITILKRRDGYRKAFYDFDVNKVANITSEYIEELLLFEGIIRNRKKIEAAVNNAKLFIDIQDEFGSFSNFIWKYVDNKPIINNFTSMDEMPAKTDLSIKISKDLKKIGFKFLGPTIIYAYMQAVGMVNDHITSCPRHSELT